MPNLVEGVAQPCDRYGARFPGDLNGVGRLELTGSRHVRGDGLTGASRRGPWARTAAGAGRER